MPGPILTFGGFGTGITFFHENDERAFCEWLERVPCVDSFELENWSVVVRLKQPATEDEIRELLGFCVRYQIVLTSLLPLETDQNRGWFRDPEHWWHEELFGG